MGVDPSAPVEVINKAYRRRSLALHPDKNPGVKDIQARFARLGVITNILRDPTKRERYNVSLTNFPADRLEKKPDHLRTSRRAPQFFYKNGVPVWRGTGYYYSRFRPSLIHVLAFLILVSTGVHWLILRMNHAKDRRRIDYFVKAARGSGSGALTTGGGTGTGTGTPRERAGGAANGGGVQGDLLASAIEQVNGSTSTGGGGAYGSAKTRRERRAESKRGGGGGGDKGSTNSGAMTPVDRFSASASVGAASNGTAPRRRKVRVPLVEGTSMAEGNGRALDLVVVGDEVFIVSPSSRQCLHTWVVADSHLSLESSLVCLAQPEEDGHLTPIETLARAPSVQALWPVKLGRAVTDRLRAVLISGDKPQQGDVGAEVVGDEEDEELEATTDGSDAAAARKPKRATSSSTTAGGAPRGQAAKVAGARRRK